MAETNGETSHEDSIKKIAGLVKGIDIAMLTTQGDGGKLHSRPMSTQEFEFDGDVYFFTYDNTPKTEDIKKYPQVGISYANPKGQDYVSLTGLAEISHDRAKMAELWNAPLKAWFPQEIDTPGIALIKVSVSEAEIWDAPSSPVAHIIGFVKSHVTGKPENVGENEKISI